MQLAMKLVGGGVLAVVGVLVARVLFAMIGAVVGFILVLLFKLAIVVVLVWLGLKALRYFRDMPSRDGL